MSLSVPSAVKRHPGAAVLYLLHSKDGHIRGMLHAVLLYLSGRLLIHSMRTVIQCCTL